MVGHSGEDGEAVLESIGAIIAMDMLLNNFDRTPFVWDHEGNANNIMFQRESTRAFAIDNTTAPITDDEGVYVCVCLCVPVCLWKRMRLSGKHAHTRPRVHQCCLHVLPLVQGALRTVHA